MLKVKPFRETPGHCGAAALKMVLEYYDVKLSEKVIARMVKAGATGSKADNIMNAAKRLGFRASVRDYSTFNDIKRYLGKGIPAIVDWFSKDDGHYSVVIGIDREAIYLQDPELGRVRRIDLKTFKRVWFDFEGEFMRTGKEVILRRIIVVYP
jgi:ABC-type bacteriocin/lantibiotic exporter with double-glycine peptidase domain